MRGSTAGIVLSDRMSVDDLGASLHRMGLRVVTVRTIDEGIETLKFTVPGVWLVGIEEASTAKERLPWLTKKDDGAIPVVALLDQQPGGRRRALTLGLTTQIALPCDDEELRLVLEATLGAPVEKPRPITGDLSTVRLSELMTMFDADSRTIVIDLVGPTTGRVVLHRGDIQEARTGNGAVGDDAVEMMLAWDRGTFSAEVGIKPPSDDPTPMVAAPPPSAPEPLTFPASTRPSAAADARPSTAGQLQAVETVMHDALALLNTLYSYVASFVEASIAVRKLEATRRTVGRRLVAVELFQVHSEGMVSMADSARDALGEVTERDLAKAVAEWILAFRVDMDQSFPGALPMGVMRVVADASSPDLRKAGLLSGLGVDQ